MKKKGEALSRHSREENLPFLLTDRDIDILRAVNRYRYLRTGQIHRLIFPNCHSNQSARRRLKYLYHNTFLERIIPYIQAGKGSGEIAYFLGKNGFELLQEEGEAFPPYSKEGRVSRLFLNHALDISEFRLILERSLSGNAIVGLKRFTADFELKGHIENAVGKKRYKLFDEVKHPVNRESYFVHPDALIILQGKGEFRDFQKLYFLEIDRGTESHSRIRDKVIGFNLYLKLGIFQKFGKFDRFLVLFQTSSAKRADNIRKLLLDQEGSDLVWVTDVSRVSEETLLHGKIWQDDTLEYRSLLKEPSP
jgi:hypothetical protein